MRAKLILIFLVSFAVFIVVLVTRVDKLIFNDKLAWNEAQSRSQMSPLIHGIEQDFRNLSQSLPLISSVLTDKKEFSASSPFSRFQMIAELKNTQDKEWSIEKSYFLEKSPSKTWALQYITLLLKNLTANEIKTSNFAVYSLLSPQRKTYLFIIYHLPAVVGGETQKTNWYGVLVGSEFFQNLIDRQKGQISNVFIVNHKGQALGHTVPEYVGNLLLEDPIVSRIAQSESPSGSGLFQDLQGESIHGFYEQVPETNVFTVITTSVNQLLKSRSEIWIQLVLMGFGMGLVGVAVFVFVYRPEKELVQVPSMSVPIPHQAVKTNSSTSEDLVKEKMNAFSQFASAISHELLSPLASILGHVQLIKISSPASEHLDGIEEQTRRARELLDKLMNFSGESSPKLEKLKFSEVVNRALRNIEPKIFRKGIHLIKDIKPVAEFELPTELLVKAIENVLQNSIEAMERNAKKDLKVSLFEANGKIELIIEDTGEGIDIENIGKIFDPFFTTRSSRIHIGLGLSVTIGILKSFQANMTVESEKQKGTKVRMLFDPKAKWGKYAEGVPTVKLIEVENNKKNQEQDQLASFSAISLSAASNPTSTLEDQEVEEVLKIESLDESPLNISIEPLPPVVLTKQTSSVTEISLEKIDTPNIDFQKKTSKLAKVDFKIRRPGDKS